MSQQLLVWSSLVLSTLTWSSATKVDAQTPGLAKAKPSSVSPLATMPPVEPLRCNSRKPSAAIAPPKQPMLATVQPLTEQCPSSKNPPNLPVSQVERSLANQQTTGQVRQQPVPLIQDHTLGKGHFKSDLVRPAEAYRAATLSPIEPLQFIAVSPTVLDVPLTTPELRSPLSPSNSKQLATDPELGTLQLEPIPGSSNQNPPPIGQDPTAACSKPDPELGCLNLGPGNNPGSQPGAGTARLPVVYLLPRIDYFRTSNVLAAIDPLDDGLLRPGLTLFASPALGPSTLFLVSATANLVRYNEQKQVNYNELTFRAGIYQQLSPTMGGEIGWTNQQLFIDSNDLFGLPRGTKFLDDHAVRLELSRRDRVFTNLTPNLTLYSFYQFRASFAKPSFQSRIINTLSLTLLYDIQPNLKAGLDYQFSLANYTRISREDVYHQVGVRLIYTMFRNIQFSLIAGYSFGRSTDPFVDFNGLVFGASLGATLALF